jgi:hypothetical protein
MVWYAVRVCCGLSINVRIAYFFSMCVAFWRKHLGRKNKNDHFIQYDYEMFEKSSIKEVR